MTNPTLTKDRGYMGDPSRGASLGRISKTYPLDNTEILLVNKVRIDSQGYDTGGVYWGVGRSLYVVYTENHDFICYIDCKNKKEALAFTREKYGA